jgi:hypothetical protein
MVLAAKATARVDAGERLGQAYFNAAWDISPRFAESIRGTGKDPFYSESQDDRFTAFVHALMEWEDNE